MEIVDCVESSRSYWFNGDYGFVLKGARKTDFKPMKGQLGFFEVSSAPQRRSHPPKTRLRPPASADFVAYHSTDLMGYEYGPSKGPFQFGSRKSPTFLEKSIGSNVWAITGTRDEKGKLIYSLAAVYTPDQVKANKSYNLIRGKHGHIFKKPILLNGRPWFQALLREQNRFSFGFNRIRSQRAVAGLRRALGRDGTGG